MGYREAAVVERYEEPVARVTFRVRHRSWAWLSAALVGASVGIWLAVVALNPANDTTLVTAGMLGPMVCFGAAFYAMCAGAGAVEMTVARRARGGFDVVLKRQWGFLPWTAPLSFAASSAPSLATRWETGWSSGKSGPSVHYRHASLVVMSGEAAIALPTMRAPSRRVGKERVAELAANVEAAMQRYREEVAALPRAKASSGPRDEDETASLIGSSDSAVSLAAGIAALAVLAVATALGGAAYALPVSRVATVCCALVVPVLFGGIGLVSIAVFQGRTLHLKRKRLEDFELIEVADYAYFGPRGMRGKTLSRGFAYRIVERTAGEEERTVYALVDAKTNETVHEDAEQSVVRRYGRALGGVETKKSRA
jgi:hypothetical protein